MFLGLEPGKAALCPYQSGWPQAAEEEIAHLRKIFGPLAADIQHIGSTAIPGILSKPILDIAVGVYSLKSIDSALSVLEASPIYHRRVNRFSSNLLYLIYDGEGRRTHQIHILPMNSEQWRNYVDFRDYMRRFPEKAKEYERLKVRLAEDHGDCQTDYTDGKHDYMESMLAEAKAYADGLRG